MTSGAGGRRAGLGSQRGEARSDLCWFTLWVFGPMSVAFGCVLGVTTFETCRRPSGSIPRRRKGARGPRGGMYARDYGTPLGA